MLRRAVKAGLDEIDRDEGLAFESIDELIRYIDQLAADPSA